MILSLLIDYQTQGVTNAFWFALPEESLVWGYEMLTTIGQGD